MKGISAFLLSLALLIATGMLFPTHRSPAAPATSKPAVRWEYKLLTEDEITGKEEDAYKGLAKGMNKLGNEGWEFAAVGHGCLFFKRQVN